MVTYRKSVLSLRPPPSVVIDACPIVVSVLNYFDLGRDLFFICVPPLRLIFSFPKGLLIGTKKLTLAKKKLTHDIIIVFPL